MNPTSAAPAGKGSWDEVVKTTLACAHPSVRIGHGCSFFSPESVFLGDRVRIDANCVVTGGLLCRGDNHISSFVWMNGKDQTVTLGRWAFIGAGSKLVTASDDYTGAYGPIGPSGKNRMDRGDITIGNFAGIAIGTTLLPGVTLPDGTCIAGNGWVTADQSERLQPFAVYACCPGGFPRLLYRRDEEAIRRFAEEWK